MVDFGNVGRGSDELFELIEKTVIKHRLGLTETARENAKRGFALVNKGSDILTKVIEDPKAPLPALEG